MSDFSEHDGNKSELTDDDLDALLSQASWVGGSDEEVDASLKRIYGASPVRGRRSFSRKAFWISTVAACVLVAVAASITWRSGESAPSRTVVDKKKSQQRKRKLVEESLVATNRGAAEREASDARKERIERLYAEVLWEFASRTAPAPTPVRPLSLAERWHRFQQRLSRWNPQQGSPGAQLLPEESRRWERSLWRNCRSPKPQVRGWSALGLAVVGSQRSVALLHTMLDDPLCRRQAAFALTGLLGDRELLNLLNDQRYPEARETLLASLLTRGDDRSASRFLEFVAYRPTRRDALACLSRLDDSHVDLLVRQLGSRSPGRRLAAAVALGRSPSRRAAERIESEIRSGRLSDAVLVALVARQEPRMQQMIVALSQHGDFGRDIHLARERLIRVGSY